MMKSLARRLLLPLLLTASTSWASVMAGGIPFSDTLQIGGQNLTLNGAGVRVKFIIDVYAAGLYLARKDHTAEGVLALPGAKSMQIVLMRNLSGEQFAEAMVSGFQKNNSVADVARFQSRMDALRQMMLSFGEAHKGTVLRLDHVPGAGTRILVDGVQKGTDIAGDDFFNALLKIWLGNEPVDADLKASLLGAP